jgi:hypothetical protein
MNLENVIPEVENHRESQLLMDVSQAMKVTDDSSVDESKTEEEDEVPLIMENFSIDTAKLPLPHPPTIDGHLDLSHTLDIIIEL